MGFLIGGYFLIFISIAVTILHLMTAGFPSLRLSLAKGRALLGPRVPPRPARVSFLSPYLHHLEEKIGIARWKIRPVELVFLQFLSGLAGATAAVTALFTSGRGGGILFLAAVLGGFSTGAFFPWLRLQEAVRSRQKGMVRELSDTLDLMVLGVEAGMDYAQVLIKILENAQKSPLREDLLEMTGEIQVGNSRAEAWRRFARRTGLPEIQSLALILVQADQAGSPVAGTLRSLSEQMRQERFRQAEKRAHEMDCGGRAD